MNGYLKESNFLMVEEGFTTRDLLENLLVELCQAVRNDQQAFFVADLGDIVKKHLLFLKALPRVKPYFPVKCNGSEGVIRLLAELGTGFACANKAELTWVQSLGVPADKIFYSSPCKQVAHIKHAASHGVQLMTFDNEVELSKVARSHPHARMLLGITADSCPSAQPMAFGTTLRSCRQLLETAKEQAVEVVGVSFHLGSHGLEPQAFTQAVAAAQLAFEMGTELGHQMHLLDIGGGFAGTEDTRAGFEEVTATINSALDLYFPEGCGVEVIATPGRFYVSSAFTLATSITAREEAPAEQPGSDEEESSSKRSLMYHLSDGIYGTFSCLLFDSPCPTPQLHKRPCPELPLHSSSFWGPPGDPEDRIADGLELPELQVGDWLIFEGMGAYTTASALPGGCPQPHITYAMSRLAWKTLQLFQGKPPQTEDERESICTPLSCGWEMAESLCVSPVFTPASII
ncbi:antizyme inhibitor 2 isoform X2 [Indicator indicator]|uniref:antizyme inhibitor 2 isoform X2 n=1 Tax=Indicator indicator TaxID=1002788 RepID=UPI0023DE9250|nr:antizyme inhibitor 2 isoform X2 [Indicator indicator]